VSGAECRLNFGRRGGSDAVDASAGEGALPLVLLHGIGGTSAAWQPVTGLLDEGREILAFDLPGHGESPLDETRGMVSQAADGIFACLDAAGIGRVHVCGHSLGGAVACVMALKQPERVASLTLLAPGGFGRALNAAALEGFVSARSEADLAAALGPFFGPGFEPSAEMLAGIARQRTKPGSSARLRQCVEMVAAANARSSLPLDELAAMGIPVAVMWGARDIITPYEQSFGLPDAFEVWRYESTGHMLIDEIPGEVAAVLARQWGRAESISDR
jgi:pyruvate dehydrogenase E2 component (dihydrolipoamide acetyltransferase)